MKKRSKFGRKGTPFASTSPTTAKQRLSAVQARQAAARVDRVGFYDATETEWTREICKDMESLGVLVLVYSGNAYGTAGIPDREFVGSLYNAKVEFKGPATPVEGHQAMLNSQLWMRCPYGNFYFRRVPHLYAGVLYRGNDPSFSEPLGFFPNVDSLNQFFRKYINEARTILTTQRAEIDARLAAPTTPAT